MKLWLSLVLLSIWISGWTQPAPNAHPIVIEDRAAGCAPANGTTYLEFNNVRALIHTGGNLWQVAGQNLSQYEVPKGSGIMALFTSALWLGGIDINGQLKIAAVRYRDGQDYWTGPLTTTGDAEITPEICVQYDKHWQITQDEVREFNAWFEAGLKDQEEGTSLQGEMFPDYEIPRSILEWPAHGDPGLDQDYYLAPFYDRNEDGFYNPADGDYPWYDIKKDLDCTTDRTVTLYGDQTIWWIMNDKGNIHTETGGDPLGMEVRCQAFAFATNDEVNNMTFYNYELVNRSTQTLYNTYFGVMIDGALGGPQDDYVGCDVSRGLAYTYNGDSFDETVGAWKGYGDNPPAAGIDFFEGPYQDDDGQDNPLVYDFTAANEADGIPYPGLGIGYGDGIVDNERLGMTRFLYYNNLGGGGLIAQTDPQTAQDYYNYLSGYWKDGSEMVYGGNGHPSDDEANPTIPADYMFPGTTDPLGWGTGGLPQPTWTEQSAGNPPYDRRFATSSGPFVLMPGAVNNITYGIVWARSTAGDPFESVKALQKADDKAQALFDNCFKVLDGPHAPNLSIQEMENELIISIYNDDVSNNATEEYEEVDPFIVNSDNDPNFDNTYRFQGYQVYQLVDATVSPTDLYDTDKARLVFQCDIKDSISRLVNYYYDDEVETSMPQVMVDGGNEGIRHSFNVTEDLFASGDRKLVNFKRYYYMAVAYSVNDYNTYEVDNPLLITGNKKPYLASRKAAIGEIISYEGIPHDPSPEGFGTVFTTNYGYEIPLTQVDGWGNGGNVTALNSETEASILTNNSVNEITYQSGASPLVVKIIDPLNVIDGSFRLNMIPNEIGELDTASWYIVNLTTNDTVFSNKTINVFNEQLIPEWGISVEVEQTAYENGQTVYSQWWTEPVDASITYADSSKRWLRFIEDNDSYYPTNWIRSGDYSPESDDECLPGELTNPCYYPDRNLDLEKKYQNLLDGGVAPFKLVGTQFTGMPAGFPDATYDALQEPSSWFNPLIAQTKISFADLHSIDLVITPDQSKWTRCPVLETSHNQAQSQGGSSIMKLRAATSKDINGNDEIGSTGMSWFPGYAIDIETGERLNMAFGENSWLNGSNGNDMLWNPTNDFVTSVGNPLFGGMHYIYIFGVNIDDSGMPVYDGGNWLKTQLENETSSSYINLWKNCMWIVEPMLAENEELLSTELRMKIRMSHPYQEKELTGVNNGFPSYNFNTSFAATDWNRVEVAQSALDKIKIVPNPYYAYSEYETNNLDTRVKITNLPEICTITIFNSSGQLVRRLDKDNPLTFMDWDLKNYKGIPISGGVYVFHIDVPGVGEKVLKWYGNLRVVDITTF